MISFPNAKINIGLHIVERRPDGYHNLETVFYPIPLCDVLEVVESEKNTYSLHGSGIAVDAAVKDNLITKAFDLLRKDFAVQPVEAYLEKIIPFGAGLGGGSADAAFMLKMLNEIFNLQLSVSQLENYASKLGADCPFFIQNKPVFATGIGNIFQNISISLKGYYIVLIKPTIYVSTADAYSGVKPQKPAYPLLETIQQKNIHEWKNYIENDFEKTVFVKYPAIEKIKNELYKQGAVYASMSGSGSSVYGIFEEEIDLKNMFADHFIWSGKL